MKVYIIERFDRTSICTTTIPRAFATYDLAEQARAGYTGMTRVKELEVEE